MVRMKSRILLLLCVAALVAGAGETTWDVTAADFPRRAGEADDTGRLQRAVDATGAGRVLYLPRGVYEVSKTLMVTNAASLLLHKSATVRAVAKMAHVIHIDMQAGTMWRCWGAKALPPGEVYDQGLFFRGGHIDGNGLASCLFLQRYFHFALRDTVFVNGFPYGLHVGRWGAEIVANGLYFRTIKRGLAGNVALFSEGSDSYYTDIFAVDYTTGLRTRGGANVFTRFHVWGGPIPPVAKGRLPEMVENSVCFDLGGHLNTLRDCYADTGATGFLVSGWAHQLVGCCYYNNPGFHLKKITIVRQLPESTALQISGGVFRADGPETKLYEGPGNVEWRGMVYGGFAPGTPLPGAAVCEPDCLDAKTADAWEFVQQPLVFTSKPGEFTHEPSARQVQAVVPRNRIAQRFPNAGAGAAFVIRLRATEDVTKRVEFSVCQTDGRIWGTELPLTREWKELRVPFDELRYFSHYPKMPKLAPGERPDARKMTQIRFIFGKWIANGTEAKAHGFEVGSIRIVGR